jgi:chromosomal replication initiator protein
VCEHLNIAEDKIRDKNRKKEIALARQIAMYLSKKLTNSSLKTIGLHFGGRDHSTVIHAYNLIENALREDPKLNEIVETIQNQIEINAM